MLLLIRGENNFMLNYKWHHFHSYAVSPMCQESSILDSGSVLACCSTYYEQFVSQLLLFVLSFEEHQILYKVFSRILCPCILVSLCKLSHYRLISRVYPLLKLLENLTSGEGVGRSLEKESVCMLYS